MIKVVNFVVYINLLLHLWITYLRNDAFKRISIQLYVITSWVIPIPPNRPHKTKTVSIDHFSLLYLPSFPLQPVNTSFID